MSERRSVGDHQTFLIMQDDRFGKGFMHRSARQNLWLFLVRCWWWLPKSSAVKQSSRQGQCYHDLNCGFHLLCLS